MNNNSILDDGFKPNSQAVNQQEFKLHYDAYFIAVQKAFRWRLIAIVSLVICGIAQFLTIGNEITWLEQLIFYLFLPVLVLLGIAYFNHFFALQKGAKLSHLFPQARINHFKISNPWVWFFVAFVIKSANASNIIPLNLNADNLFYWAYNLAALHACLVGVQQLLLEKYRKNYLPAILDENPFPTIGFAPYVCFLISTFLFFCYLFLALASASAAGAKQVAIFAPMVVLAFLVSFVLGVLYIALYIQVKKQTEKIKLEKYGE